MPDVSEIRWPNGFTEFYYKVKLHKKKILEGTLVAVDPASGSSSRPGFAVFEAGVMVFGGTLDIPKKLPIDQRLRILGEKIATITKDAPDVFVIELIRGRMVHFHLQWSIGASIAASRAPIMIECPILCWRTFAKSMPGYTKDDAKDAEAIGRTLIALARRE